MDIRSGLVKWELNVESASFFNKAFIDGGILYVYDEVANYRKIDVYTGAILLEKEERLVCNHPTGKGTSVLPRFYLTTVVNTGQYFVGCTKQHAFIYCIHKESGELVYLDRLTKDAPSILKPLRYINGSLYVQLQYEKHQELKKYEIG